MNNIPLIKKQIKKECEANKITAGWFYGHHLLVVEKNAKWVLAKLPKVDKEIVMLGVWLHDLQRVRGLKGDHQKVGAREAGKVMKEYGYDADTIGKVKAIILTHSCHGAMPKTEEGKVLATADGMAHYYNDFFLRIAVKGDRTLTEYKKWAIKKLKKNYTKKIHYGFARQRIKTRHELYMKVFSMK